MTLVELLIVMGIMITIAALAIPASKYAIERARVTRAVGDILTFQTEINQYRINFGRYPDTLADISRTGTLDPWGRPYQYLNYDTVKGTGPMRKDRFLVPLNRDYDLYSMGPDGQSVPPLTAKASRDDIVRANDGAFVGPASDY